MGISSDLTSPNKNGGRKGNQLNLLRKFLGGKNKKKNKQLGGGFKYFFVFIPIPGEMESNLMSILFFNGVETTN